MRRIEFNCPSDFDLIDHGDTHGGDLLFHAKGHQKMVDYILEEDNRFWIHKGDWVEAITVDDKRYNIETAVPRMTPLQQRDYMIDLYRPIATRGICGLLGNHEAKLHRFGNLAEDICKAIDVPYGSYSCRVLFKDGKRKLFNGFFTHGRWVFSSAAKDYEQRQANMRAALKMRLKYKIGDCALQSCGHAHKLLVVKPTNQLYLHDTPTGLRSAYLTGKQTGNFIDPDHRWFGCSGSFLRLYEDGITGYAEMAGYDPVEIGFLVWKIRDGIIVDCERMVL